jgi:glycosyltransferase involved in cell wall biosynthesis
MNDTAIALKQPAGGSAGMRIAIVTETFPPEINGVAMTIGRMLDGLLRRGHDIQLVRPRQHEQDVPQVAGRLCEVLVRGVPLPRYYGLRMGLPATRALARLWKTERPHIVHIVTEGPLGASALSAARRLGIPASTDFHTNFHSYSRHYGFGLLKPLIAGYLKRFHNRAACTFVPTRELQAQLAGEGYRDLLVVARGVDTGLFSPAGRSVELRKSWGVSESDVVVIHVGRLAPEKNLPLVLAAFDGIKRRLPSSRLVLVGDGPQRAELEPRYPGHVFVGIRRGADLAAHYASGDLFLFPSLTETFGNVTVEAMSSGLAVVAYDYAAAREHVVHGETGLLAPFDDARTFVRLATDLAVDGALRSKLGRNARLAAKRIDWDEVVEEFALALQGLADTREASHAIDMG